MDTSQFLQHVLPTVGPYCVCIQKVRPDGTKTYWHFAEDTIEGMVRTAQRQDAEQQNVFFAVGALVKGRVWDREKQQWRIQRTGDNIRALRSYILDIDTGFNKDGVCRGYTDWQLGIEELKKFVRHFRLPRPTVVLSGNGLHVYWTLTEEVPTPAWKAWGAALKSMAQTYGLRIDPGRTADAASVLRVVGTHNYKYDARPVVTVLIESPATPPESMHAILSLQEPEAANKATLQVALAGAPVDLGVADNTVRRDDLPPVDPRVLMEQCALFKYVCDEPAKASEPAWHGAVMMCIAMGVKGDKFAHRMSSPDPRYNAAQLDSKLVRLRAKNYPAITCTKWQEDLTPDELDRCKGCRWNGKIKSPAYVSHSTPPVLPALQVRTVAPATGLVQVKEISPPPDPFARFPEGIGLMIGNPKSGAPEKLVFCPYDMYPLRMQFDERTRLAEGVVWMANLPYEGWTQLDIPHTPKNQLQQTLAKRGMYVDTRHLDFMEHFMTAYVRKLQQETPREMAYAKMGWRDDGFVIGDTLYRKDGVAEQHAMGAELEKATSFGMRVEGDFDAWRLAVGIYNRPGLEPYRAYLYSAFGSIFYGMTGQIATIVNATGETGLGKSTLLDVCASIWGDPQALVVRGTKDGSTRNAVEAVADAMQHLPVMLDEITDRDAKEMADVIFNYSGGKGKIRSKAGGGLRADTASWSNFALCNANADEYARMASVYRDSAAHLVRLVQIDFTHVGVIQKHEGDKLRQDVRENFGHAGRLFVEYVSKYRADLQKLVRSYVIETDKRVGAKSEERFWTGWIAAARIGAEVAYHLGLIPGFPVTNDVQWMCDQIKLLRGRVTQHGSTADEVISEYLDHELGHTLTINPKSSGNIDNVVTEPRNGFTVRFEADIARVYIARSPLQEYCIEKRINLSRVMKELVARHVVLHENTRKVLGAGTKFAKGNVRCVEIDMAKLVGRPQLSAVGQAQSVVAMAANGV